MKLCLGCMEELKEGANPCPACGYAEGTPPKEAYHLRPGVILKNQYLIGRVIGYGGFGVTYLGYDLMLNRKAAIKEYLPSEFSTRMLGENKLTVYGNESAELFRRGLESFIVEAKRLAKFNNIPGVVDIYDSFMENDTGYIIMEYLEGETAKQYLARSGGRIGYEDAKSIMLPVMDALAEVHKAGIIHRDIAPDNIFLNKKDGGREIKLLDFGAARYATTYHSKSLSVILKPGYAPEEQYRSRGQQGPWSDVYAAGATFYKLITGITPEESMERAIKDTLQEPSRLGAQIPKGAENAIMNALNVKAEERTKSAEEFKKAILNDGTVRIKAKKTKSDAGKFPLWLKIAMPSAGLALCIFFALVAAGILNIGRGKTTIVTGPGSEVEEGHVTVPQLINLSFEEAETEAYEISLAIERSAEPIISDNTPANKIVNQYPLPGRVIELEGTVVVDISAGKGSSFMPDLINMNKDTAEEALKNFGLSNIEFKYENSDNAPGTIISQSERVNGIVEKEKLIVLTVSLGLQDGGAKIEIETPDLMVLNAGGWNLTYGEAEAKLQAAALYAVRMTESSLEVPEGHIIRQEPAAGTKIMTGESVIVVMSTGTKTTLPDVRNLSEGEAIAQLRSLGLEVECQYRRSSETEDGIVMQYGNGMNAGQEVDVLGDIIIIYVSSGPGETEENNVGTAIVTPTPRPASTPQPTPTPPPTPTPELKTPEPQSTPQPVTTAVPAKSKAAPSDTQAPAAPDTPAIINVMTNITDAAVKEIVTITVYGNEAVSQVRLTGSDESEELKSSYNTSGGQHIFQFSVTSREAGSVTYTAYGGDASGIDQKAKRDVAVNYSIKVKSINLSLKDTGAHHEFYQYLEHIITYNLSPVEAKAELIWECSDESIVKTEVTASGLKLYFLKLGKVTITARTADGSVSAKCKIQVVENPEGNVKLYTR